MWAELWLERMHKEGLSPTLVTYGTVCKAYANAGRYDRVEALVDRVIKAAGPRALNGFLLWSLFWSYAMAAKARGRCIRRP